MIRILLYAKLKALPNALDARHNKKSVRNGLWKAIEFAEAINCWKQPGMVCIVRREQLIGCG
jgi:hypothetical protein